MPQPPFQAPPIWLALIFVFFLCISQQGVHANGAYEPYLPNSTCVPMSSLNETMGICLSVLAGRYDYVYSDSADDYRAQMSRLHAISALVADKSCTSPFAVISCMLRWRECVPIEVPANVTNSSAPTTINVARDLCIRTCELTTSSCASFLAFLPLGSFEPWQISNCTYPNYLMWTQNVVNPFRNPADPSIPLTLYLSPNETVIYEIDLPCFYLDPRNFTIDFTAACPSPLIYDPSTGACTVGCPLPLISDNDYETLEITMSVLGWISFVLTTILIATYLLDPHRRSYPAVLPLYFIFCTNATSFAFCLGSMVKHEDVWCNDDGGPNEFGGGACTVQGIIWVYFTLAGVLWWLMIVVNMLVMMLIPNALQRIGRWHYCYHFVWLLPVITLIISLSAEKLGYGGDVWCSVHIGDPSIKYVIEGKSISSDYDEETYLWNLLLIVIPILLMVIVGTVIVVGMVVYMIFKWRQFGWSYVLLQWRLFLFTFFYIYIYTFLFVFEIIRIAQTPDQYDNFIEWISCTILETNLNSAGIYGFYTCNLDQQVSFPLWYIVVFNASVQGIVVFGIFGTSWRMYKGWYNLVMHPRKIWSSSASLGVSKNSSESLQKIEGHQHLNSRTEKKENDEGGEDDEDNIDTTSTEEEGEGTELQEIEEKK